MEKIFEELHAQLNKEYKNKSGKHLPFFLLYQRNGDILKVIGRDRSNSLFTTSIFQFKAYFNDCDRLVLIPVNLHTGKLSHSDQISVSLHLFCGFQWIYPQELDAFKDLNKVEKRRNIDPGTHKEFEGSMSNVSNMTNKTNNSKSSLEKAILTTSFDDQNSEQTGNRKKSKEKSVRMGIPSRDPVQNKAEIGKGDHHSSVSKLEDEVKQHHASPGIEGDKNHYTSASKFEEKSDPHHVPARTEANKSKLEEDRDHSHVAPIMEEEKDPYHTISKSEVDQYLKKPHAPTIVIPFDKVKAITIKQQKKT